MTDIIRVIPPETPGLSLVEAFKTYNPDWSRNTMNTVNELTSQFYGWLPKVPEIPSTQGDPVTWGILGIIALILLYKL